MTREEAADIIYGDNPDWKKVNEDVEDIYKNFIHKTGIFLNIPSNKHYQLWWSTTNDGWGIDLDIMFDDEIVVPSEVELVETVRKSWQPVKREQNEGV